MKTLSSSPLFRAAIVTVIVFALGVGSDLLLNREGISRLDLMLLGDAMAGVAVGGLFLIHTARVQERQRELERKLRVVAEMNHHIRNALQPLLYFSSMVPRVEQRDMVRDSIKRIEWALHEILPGEAEKDARTSHSASDRINKIHAPE